MIKRVALGLVALVLTAFSAPAFAANSPGISQKVAPCDWSFPGNCQGVRGDGASYGSQVFVDVSASPTVTAASAYSTGNVVGGLLTFTNVTATAAPATGGRVEEVTIYSKSSQTAELDLVWCGSLNPTNTTLTDKAAVALAVADFNKCRVVAQLTNWQNLGAPSSATTGQIATPFSLASGSTGYGFLVTRGAPTFTATTDLQVTLRIGR
jgi:hypothetical protein